MAEKEEGVHNITEVYKMLKDAVNSLRKEMSEGFSKIHTEIELGTSKSTMKDLEKSIEFTQ